ncbi:MAG: N-acetyltransferase family protein [Ignavibacteriae bacterium]|nr:MAG: N-acetyltransferase family protein [Ignavibacteriota bacterium]
MKTSCMIRKAGLSDVEAIKEIYNDAILTTTATFDTEPKSTEDRRRWFESHDARHPVWIAELDGKVAGWASLSEWSDRPAYNGTGESSVYVRPEFHGRKIGTALMQTMIDEARRLQYQTIIARIAGESEVSLMLHKKLGFVRIGTMKEVGRKFGKLLDVHILQKMLE